MDLWSIFNFLNPGYLGKQAQFRKQFELPIQRENDPRRSTTLKKLVEPFILRRLKTDQSIIKDLPDKVEQKLFCNLTPEQASLYEAVVKDVAEELKKRGHSAQGVDPRHPHQAEANLQPSPPVFARQQRLCPQPLPQTQPPDGDAARGG
jgi:SNF2 family DNA or RNA helicase